MWRGCRGGNFLSVRHHAGHAGRGWARKPISSAGADEVAAIARALFVAMVNARRDPPDAAQRHEAEQTALIDPDRIR